VLLHLVAAHTWDRWPLDQDYVAPSLQSEGFIHCTGDEDTLLAVANAFYRDDPGEMLALELDEARLGSAVRWEPPAPTPPPGVAADVLFPHVYAPVPRDAVVAVRRLRRGADGTFLGYAARTRGASPSAPRTQRG
jgi:uncharacterized protein (DUF952 family)